MATTSCSSSVSYSAASASNARARRAVPRMARMVARCSDRVLRQGSEPGAALELLIGGAAAKLIAQRLGSIHDQSLELADCLRASDHGTLTSSGQYPQGLAVTQGPRCGQVFPAEGFAGGADRVQVIGLCTVATRRTGGSIDLDHPFAVLEQRCGEPGAVTSRALDGPTRRSGACWSANERSRR